MNIQRFLLYMAMIGVFVICGACSGHKEPEEPKPSEPPTQGEYVESGEGLAMEGEDMWLWQDVTINGMGWVTGVVVCSNAPYQMYARTDVGGAYRYNRERESWEQMMDAFGLNERAAFSVDGIAVDPNNGDVVYIAANGTDNRGEIWRSTDAGHTWTATGLREAGAIYIGGNDDYRMTVGERLSIDPHNSGIVYFASRRDGLLRLRTDSPWENVPVHPDATQMPGFTFVAFDQNGGTVTVDDQTVCKIFYVGAFYDTNNAEQNGIYKTMDGGETFIKLTGLSYNPAPFRGAVNADGVFIATAMNMDTGLILRCERDSFTVSEAKRTGDEISGLAVNPADGQRFVILSSSIDNPVYFSDAAGLRWAAVPQENGLLVPYATEAWCHPERGGYVIDPADPAGKTAFSGTGFGVVKTINLAVNAGTVVWDDHTQGISELCVNIVRAAPLSDGPDIHIGTLDMGGFTIADKTTVPTSRLCSSNTGAGSPEWSIPLAGITGMDYCYSQPQYMAYTGWHQFGYYTDFAWKFGITVDGGANWTEISIPQNQKEEIGVGQKESAGALAISATDPYRIVWSPVGGFVRYSTDMGQTWHDGSAQISEGVNNKFAHDSAIQCLYERSMPYWGTTQNLAADRVNGDVFYLFTQRDSLVSEFWRSADGGETWAKTYTGNTNSVIDADLIDALYLPFANVRVNPAREGDVYIAIKPGHTGTEGDRAFQYRPLWRSTDPTCTNFEQVPGVQACVDVAFGKGDNADTPYTYIYGLANGDTVFGVYRSTDDGRTWTRITNDNQQYGNISGLEADMRYQNRVYLYTGGRGIVCGELY